MNNYRKLFLGMLAVVLVILTACDSSDKSSAPLDNQSQTIHSTQNKTENINHPRDVLKNEEDPSTTNTVSLKEEYLQKFQKTKRETDEIREKSKDENTYALKAVEGDRYDVWDGLLNEVYQVLIDQLSSEEMEQLRIEQREWIDYRDRTAKEASLKYQNGTHEQLEYVTVQNNLTEERCFELVEDYMK